MTEIKVDLDNLTEEERKQLLSLVEKGNKPKSKVWKPKSGEKHWSVCSDGGTYKTIWNNSEYDESRHTLGNCFKTQEEAEFEVERLKVIAELKRFSIENDGELYWHDRDAKKCFIAYGHHNKEIDIDYQCSLQHSDIYFSSEEIALNAIEAIGEDRIKKYYLRVKE